MKWTLQKILFLVKIEFLIALEAAKLYFMINCGCQYDELNNWVTTSIRDPYYWRIASDGTRFVAGPYSSLWYLFNHIAQFGYFPWMLYLLVFDVFLSTLVFLTRGWKFLIPYMMSSIYFYNIDPTDWFVFMFSVLGMFTPVFSILALLIKIPYDPLWLPQFRYVWGFVLNNPYGIHEPGGWLRYLQIGAWFIWGITFYLYRRRQRLRFDAVNQKN